MTPEGKKFFESLSELGKLAVYVGFTEQSGRYDKEGEGNATVAQIAAFNEFGTSTIPARPFMQDTVNQHPEEVKALFKDAMSQIKHGAEAQQILNQIGVTAVGMMQEQILDGQYAPNAPSTIRKKTKDGKVGDHPLIDTARMLQNIKYVIR